MQLGGRLRLEPLKEEVRHARQILQGVPLGPPDTVPLFVCPALELEGGPGIGSFVPAFLREADLRATLRKAGASPADAQVQVTSLQAVTDELGRAPAESAPRMRVVASTEKVRDTA